MIDTRLEELWKTAADDGASAPMGPAAGTDHEADGLLDAWYLERQKCIEFEMLLRQSRRVIASLLADGVHGPRCRRKARRFLHEIDRSVDSADFEE